MRLLQVLVCVGAASVALSSCSGRPSRAVVTTGDTQRSAAAAKVNERRRDGPWIVAAGQTAGREGSPPALSDDPAPVRVAASVETEAWIDAMLGVLAPTGSWTVTSVYDVREDWGGVIRVATLHGPHAVLSVSKQVLTEPLAILPDSGEPGSDRRGRYERRPDGSELLVVNLDEVAGGSPGDHRVYFVASDGEMLTLNLVGFLAQDDRSTGPALGEEQLVTLATSMGERID